MSYLRKDFWAITSDKQLNFFQHVRSLLTGPWCPVGLIRRQKDRPGLRMPEGSSAVLIA